MYSTRPTVKNLQTFLYKIYTYYNNVATVLSHSKILGFAGDFKPYHKNSGIEDRICLQSALDSLVAWGECLGLSFIVSKCKSTTFSRVRAPLKFSYSINGAVRSRLYC